MSKSTTSNLNLLSLTLILLCFLCIPEVCEEAYSSESSDLKILCGQADSLLDISRLDSAEVLIENALTMVEEIAGKNDTTYAHVLNLTGKFWLYKGIPIRALEFFEDALRINSALLGPMNIAVGKICMNIGIAYTHRENYSEAEHFFYRAANVFEHETPPDSLLLARCYNASSIPYINRNRFEQAESLLVKAVRIFDNLAGDNEVSSAMCFHNLALVYSSLGEKTIAEDCYTRALNVMEREFGYDNPNTRYCATNLANYYTSIRNYLSAESLHVKVIKSYEKSFGPRNFEMTDNLRFLSLNFYYQGKYSQALQLALKSKDICSNRWGTLPIDRPDNYILGSIFATTGDYDKAWDYFDRGFDYKTGDLQSRITQVSESMQLLYIEQFRDELNKLLSLAMLIDDKSKIRGALRRVFEFKGLILDAISRNHKFAFCVSDPVVEEKLTKLSEVNDQISDMFLRKSEFARLGDTLNVLYNTKELLEIDLSELCAEFAEELFLRNLHPDYVIDNLPPNSAFWEYVRYRPYHFDRPGNDEDKTGSEHYMAFYLDSDGVTRLHDLGEVEPIDSLIAEWRETIRRAGGALLGRGQRGINPELETLFEQEHYQVTSQIYERIFRPLEGHLNEKDRIIICPDGELNHIPFGIIPLPNQKYAIEKYHFSYVSSARSYIRSISELPVKGEGAIIMTDPDFDSSNKVKSEAYSPMHTHYSSATIIENSRSIDCIGGYLTPLPNTREEGESISEKLSGKWKMEAEHYFGQSATEKVLKNIDIAPLVLHLATHGFFCGSSNDIYGMESLKSALLRSGIALAGANSIIGDSPGNTDVLSRGHDDGILTALEVSNLNLLGCDLVILSACETGLGEIENGEGVFGLRRSFEQAGARSLIMSLWDVPDWSTRMMMETFYDEWLSGSVKSEALRNSQLSILDDRREKHGCCHPVFWGGFVLLGDPY
ncbi:MAG: CHAT domain-containing protein [candidate division Zixibacteria bacterium]|nr:CHAT domain-containing protein [candidate division Zixibacteria bacterium]